MKDLSANFIPDEIYKSILSCIPICTVDVVFLNKEKNKILLCKRNNEPAKGLYFTIGGRWYKGETLSSCALRQAKLELKLDLDPKNLIFIGIIEEHWEKSAFEVSQDNLDVFYAYVLEDDTIDIILDEQHSDCKWFAINDPSFHENVKERVRQVLLKIV